MKRIISMILAVALVILPVASVVAANFPDLPGNEAVRDEVGVLTPATISHLTNINIQMRGYIHSEVMFYIREFVPAGTDIASYTADVFDHWGVGDAERNTGILVVVATADGVAHMVVGEGLASYMPRSVIDGYFAEYFYEYFAMGNYDMAVMTLFNALANNMYQLFLPAGQNQGAAAPYYVPRQTLPAEDTDWGAIIPLLVIIVLVLAVMSSMGRNRRRRMMGPMGGPMIGRRRWGMGGFFGGYMMGRHSANRQHRNQQMGGFGGNQPGGFNRGGNTRGGGGGLSGGGVPPRTGGFGGGMGGPRPGGGYGGGFSRGGSTRGGGGGISRGGMGRRR
ncbi:MAG: TPM domain-containing protein [Defluviitaleaceae bacterium]|nr:TPM domain-containing protein [Defluviitaleaceae bacterium]